MIFKLGVIKIGIGAATAHCTVEGTHFFGISLAKILPYTTVRTWHLQLAVFFIATCFLAAGLFIGPFVGKEPRAQGINTTPIHSHTALFGVYGLLAISLLLFSVRHIVSRASLVR